MGDEGHPTSMWADDGWAQALRQCAEPKMGGTLTSPTAPQMTDVAPNRWGGTNEPPKGKALRAGRRSGNSNWGV